MPDLGKYLTELPEALTLDDDDILYTVVGSGTTTSKKVKKSTILSADRTARATAEGTIVANFASPYSTTTSYAVGDYCIKDLVLYKCTSPTSGTWDSSKWTQVTALDLTSGVASDLEDEIEARQSADETLQGEIDEVVADVNAVETALETKAEQNGVYDDLVAGNLLSDSYTADNTPYLYRQSPSASSVSQNLIGASVAWNQLVQNGNFADTSGWVTAYCSMSVSNNKATISYSSNKSSASRIVQDFSAIANHVYILSATFTLTYASETTIRLRSSANYQIKQTLSANTKTTVIGTVKPTDNEVATFNIFPNYSDTATTSDTAIIENAMVIDLTQAFGSTIADYIYSLEQSTAGSGIAWLKSYGFLTKDYYAYDSGSLQSVNVSGRKIVGFNQWDEEWEQGYYNANGNKIDVQNAIRSKNHIPCLPNTTYYIHNGTDSNGRIQFYDASKNWIGTLTDIINHTVTTPNNCYYINISTGTTYGGTYNNDICINISDASKNGTYEPYTKHTYPTSPIDLRGLFKLSNGNLVADGDVYNSDGSVARKYGVVTLNGTQDFADSSPTSNSYGGYTAWFNYNGAGMTNIKKSGTDIPKISDKFTYVPRKTTGQSDIPIGCFSGNVLGNVAGDNYICFSFSSEYNTYEKIRTWFANNPTTIIYELATPTSETAEPFENPQLVGSTEEFIDTRDVPIPVGGERKYYTDLKAKLEELAKIPDVPSTNGTYTLKATRSASGVTYAWVSG